MDPADIEEFNRVRVSMGMKPLPVPGASGPEFKEKAATPEDGEEPASTLETREAAAYDNYKKIQDAEAAKKKREEKNAAIKKARDAAKRFENLQGKGLGEADDDGDMDAKAWLISQKKRQKKIARGRQLEEELAAAEAEAAAAVQYTSKDLAGVKVAHEISAFEDGDEQILTLKDSNVLGDEDEEGDELENINLRESELLGEKLELKKKKPVYDPNAADESGERSLLAQYDEEISGKKSKKFTLDAQGSGVQVNEATGEPESRKQLKINLDILQDETPASDYLDISEIKVKKPKKKKSKSTRQRAVDDDDIFPLGGEQQDQSMDIDSGAGFVGKKRKVEDSTFVDDEDLQATLAAQRRDALKKRKRSRPEDLARQLRQEAATPEVESEDTQGGGLVLDETSEWIGNIRKEEPEERKPRASATPARDATTAMEDDSDEDEHMDDRDDDEHTERIKREESEAAALATTGVDEEKTIGTGAGLGAALQLLKERNLILDANSDNLNEQLRDKAIFLAEKKRREQAMEQSARDQRERDRSSGKLDRMSVREREEWARQQNNIRDQQSSRQMVDLFNRGYKPKVELKYHDEYGRSLDQKEAFKHLSHQFHGKGSGKGKTDKRLKKIEDEKRRESQSMLDASQNVGMSSAAAHQLKRRKEAGVRLA